MYDGGDGRLFYSSSMTKFPELIAQPLKTTCQYVSFEELVGTFWSVLLSDYNCLLAAQILCMVDINLLTENPVSIFPYILSQILLNKPALNSNEFKTEELFSNLHNSFEFIFRHSRYNTAIIGLSALTVTEVNERAWLLLESFTVWRHLFVILKDKAPPPPPPLSPCFSPPLCSWLTGGQAQAEPHTPATVSYSMRRETERRRGEGQSWGMQQ